MQQENTRRWRRSATVIGLLVGAMLGSVAFAQWLTDGEGKGQAQAGVAEDLVVTEAAPSDALYPGGTAAVALTIHNPNPYPVTVSMVRQVAGQAITSDTAGCDVSNHGVTFSTQATSIGVAGNGSTTAELPDAAAMSLDSADVCQGATFSIPLRVTGAAGGGGTATSTWYRDADGDGYGSPSNTTAAATQPDGYVDNSGDCDDAAAGVNPGATETANGIDDDCDSITDEGVGTTWYADGDGDGYGDPANSTTATTPPTGFVATSSDCDDSDATVHPDATETANGTDDDCDGDIDEGLGTTWYADADGDGYGTTADTVVAPSQPTDYVATSSDCDDTDATIHPTAIDVADDGVDQDCDGVDG